MRIRIAVRFFITAPRIPDKAVIIAVNVDGVADEPIIGLVLRLDTALHRAGWRRWLRFKAHYPGNGICAILQRSCAPDNFNIIIPAHLFPVWTHPDLL